MEINFKYIAGGYLKHWDNNVHAAELGKAPIYWEKKVQGRI